MKSPLAPSLPRYAVVAQALMRDIEQGTFAVGSMIPTELEICERFGISRYTAREAVRRLTEAGLVHRRAGVGTTVKARKVSTRYTASISDPGELIAFTRQTRMDLLSEDRVQIAGDWLKLLPDAQGQVWPRFIARRFMPDVEQPIAYTEILVAPEYEAIRDRIHKPGEMVYRLIEQIQGGPVDGLRQEISCLALSKRVAALLDARAGSPALQVLRYYLGKDDVVLSVAINTYPQDRFKLVTQWKLDWGPQAE